MGSKNCSVTCPGGNKLWASVSWDSDLIVTVEMTGGDNCREWKLKVRGATGNSNNIYYETDPQFPFTFTFQATEGGEYIFQTLDDLSYQPYNNDFETSGFTVSSSDDSGDSGDESGSTTSNYYLFIYEGDGTSLKVERTWNEATGEDYEGSISSGTEIHWKDYFEVTVGVLTGYQNAKVSFTNFNIISETKNDDGTVTYAGTMSEKDNISVTSSATLKSYKLSATADTGSYITVTRTSSKQSGASLGVLTNGATIYHFDTLEISVGVEAGYDIVDTIVTGCTENDDGTFTVTGDVKITVTTKLTGLVYIDNGTTFVPCLIFIDNGVNWVQCIPYIDNGTSWVLCS